LGKEHLIASLLAGKRHVHPMIRNLRGIHPRIVAQGSQGKKRQKATAKTLLQQS
jgi:hypothetical protein